MDSMYDFPMFEHGIHDTNQKVQYYRNFISFLLGELKTLQAAMCTSCREKCGSSAASGSGSQSFAASNNLSLGLRPLKRRHVEDAPALPRIAEMDTFNQAPQAASSSSPPINETTASDSIVEISTELGAVNHDPTFYARKDDLADIEVDVEFVHSFCHERKLVSSVCFGRDGIYLAVAITEGDQGAIVIYDVESCARYCKLKEYASQYGTYERPLIDSLCFGANGRYLAARDYDYRIIIWDLSNKRIRSIFQGHDSDDSTQVRFSPDGRLVAFCEYIELVVLNLRDNSRKMVSECSCFDFSPNGRHIATGNLNGDLAILDIRSGKVVKRWNGHGTCLFHMIFTSHGKRLLCEYGGVIEHWDLNEAEPILIRKFDIQSYLYAISPDNQLFLCSNELHDVNSGKLHCTLEGHEDIASADFSTAGTYLAMSDYDGVVSLWKYAWR